ncbi:hypothetical protein FY557_19485 [Chryseobacterium sp. SN22]|uniref:hypothetical protein n=1 Tax=Chryseobacterium sp. SN22 TaxID=2606431 RepID=UPI0011EBC2F8|nr:hypothetical protein [Chryseobacterium sp. SN22]KAA0126034.1 hypothetical protein FY557_19485 [Chryseobacterium sp. SN22]
MVGLLIGTSETLAQAVFFNDNDLQKELNLTLLEKIKLIDLLSEDEQQALLKMIDQAISNKRMKDNLQQIITQ